MADKGKLQFKVKRKNGGSQKQQHAYTNPL